MTPVCVQFFEARRTQQPVDTALKGAHILSHTVETVFEGRTALTRRALAVAVCLLVYIRRSAAFDGADFVPGSSMGLA